MSYVVGCFLAISLALLPGPALAQSREMPATPKAMLLAGLGNDFGWLGTQASAYLGSRLALFAALGYTPAVDAGDPSGVTGAAGLRGLSRGRRHRGLLEVGLTQVLVETSLTTLAGVRARRLYGPTAQLGYQYANPSGLTALVTFGAGYTLSAPVTGSRFQPVFGLGLGYTFRKRASGPDPSATGLRRALTSGTPAEKARARKLQAATAATGLGLRLGVT